MRIVFAGTPEFAVPCLRAAANKAEVVAVYTQPDRPAGRGRGLTPSPVKLEAVQRGIPVLQPENFRSSVSKEALRALQPDLMVVVAYGLLLPRSVLAIPQYGCWNVHASLLPRWRGAAPIQRAIEAGDAETGVCLMQMEAGLDTGPVLLEQRTPLGRSLAQIGAVRHAEDGDILFADFDLHPTAAERGRSQLHARYILREEAHMVDGWGEIDDSLVGDTVQGRLEAYDPAERGRPDDRADGLRPQRQRTQAGCDSRRRPTARAPRRVCGVVGVACGSWLEICKLGGYGLARNQCPRRAQQPHRDSFLAGESFRRHRRARLRHKAGDMENVLHTHQGAKEIRPLVFLWVTCQQFIGFAVQTAATIGLRYERPQLSVQRSDAVAHFVDVLVQVQLAGAQSGDGLL